MTLFTLVWLSLYSLFLTSASSMNDIPYKPNYGHLSSQPKRLNVDDNVNLKKLDSHTNPDNQILLHATSRLSSLSFRRLSQAQAAIASFDSVEGTADIDQTIRTGNELGDLTAVEREAEVLNDDTMTEETRSSESDLNSQTIKTGNELETQGTKGSNADDAVTEETLSEATQEGDGSFPNDDSIKIGGDLKDLTQEEENEASAGSDETKANAEKDISDDSVESSTKPEEPKEDTSDSTALEEPKANEGSSSGNEQEGTTPGIKDPTLDEEKEGNSQNEETNQEDSQETDDSNETGNNSEDSSTRGTDEEVKEGNDVSQGTKPDELSGSGVSNEEREREENEAEDPTSGEEKEENESSEETKQNENDEGSNSGSSDDEPEKTGNEVEDTTKENEEREATEGGGVLIGTPIEGTKPRQGSEGSIPDREDQGDVGNGSDPGETKEEPQRNFPDVDNTEEKSGTLNDPNGYQGNYETAEPDRDGANTDITSKSRDKIEGDSKVSALDTGTIIGVVAGGAIVIFGGIYLLTKYAGASKVAPIAASRGNPFAGNLAGARQLPDNSSFSIQIQKEPRSGYNLDASNDISVQDMTDSHRSTSTLGSRQSSRSSHRVWRR